MISKKQFDVLVISLSVLHNYFGDTTKLFLILYFAKFRYYSKTVFSILKKYIESFHFNLLLYNIQ